MHAFDTKLGGSKHDVTRPEVREAILFRLAAGGYDAVMLAPPCSSFSVRRTVRLRSIARPWGIHPLSTGWSDYLETANAVVRATLEIMRVSRAAGIPLALENPAARGDPSSYAYWEEFADWGSLWDIDEIRDELAASGAQSYTFAQCAERLGGKAQKWTTIAATGALATELASLRQCLCAHGVDRHDEVLSGRDALGRSRAAMAAAYPAGLDTLIADGLERAGTSRRAAWHADPEHPTQPTTLDHTTPTTPLDHVQPTAPSEGRITDGPDLGAEVASACENARTRPARFSASRNRDPNPLPALRSEAFPGDLTWHLRSLKPLPGSKANRRKRLPGKSSSACCGRLGKRRPGARPLETSTPAADSGDTAGAS